MGIGFATSHAGWSATRRSFHYIGAITVGLAFGIAFVLSFVDIFGWVNGVLVGLLFGILSGGLYGSAGKRKAELDLRFKSVYY